MTARRDLLHDLFPGEAPAPRASAEAREANRVAPRSAHQQRADDTTRVAREATEAATATRAAQVAKLRQARLEKDRLEKEAAAAAVAVEKPKRARKKA